MSWKKQTVSPQSCNILILNNILKEENDVNKNSQHLQDTHFQPSLVLKLKLVNPHKNISISI